MLNVGWVKFCVDHNLDPDTTLVTLQLCEKDVRPHLALLEIIAAAFGRDLVWLLTGIPGDTGFTITIKERTHELVDEYIRRDDVPEEDHGRLHAYVERMIQSLEVHTPQAAYRRGLPQTWRDMARIYQDMLETEG
jgi:hypothetical protein